MRRPFSGTFWEDLLAFYEMIIWSSMRRLIEDLPQVSNEERTLLDFSIDIQPFGELPWTEENQKIFCEWKTFYFSPLLLRNNFHRLSRDKRLFTIFLWIEDGSLVGYGIKVFYICTSIKMTFQVLLHKNFQRFFYQWKALCFLFQGYKTFYGFLGAKDILEVYCERKFFLKYLTCIGLRREFYRVSKGNRYSKSLTIQDNLKNVLCRK